MSYEFFQQFGNEFFRRVGGLAAIRRRDDRRVMIGHNLDPCEEPSPASRPEMRQSPAFVWPNAPPQSKSVVASAEWAVEPLVHLLGAQRAPATQPVQVVGRIEGEVSNRTMRRARWPQADRELTRFVKRQFDNAPPTLCVTARLVRSLRCRGIAEAQTLHRQRAPDFSA